MATKKKTKTDQATAVPKPGMVTTPQKIVGAREQLDAFDHSPGKAAAPQDVVDAAKAWGKATDDLDTNTTAIAPAEAALQVLRDNEPVLLRRWRTKKRAFFSAVNLYTDGSADKVTGLALKVQTRTPAPPASPPDNVRDARPRTRGTAEARWDPNQHDYMVQTCTNPADAATYTEPVHVSKAKYTLAGQTPGATLHVRVLTLDARLPGGKSEYTPWVPISVTV